MSLVLLLHAHLPYVRDVEREGTLEEDWLYEAITDVYLPLCRVLEAWHADGVDARLTVSISPTLAAMLTDELLVTRYAARLDRLIDFAAKETEPLAKWYADRLARCRADFSERYGRDLTKAFATFLSRGQIELATSSATHAYLPLLSPEPTFQRSQIRIGVRSHERVFGKAPRGFWLPECGYEPGLDAALADAGLEWFVLDTHGVTNADPPPSRGHRAPLLTKHGVVAFARDPSAAASVWSDRTGYPSDVRYRERYRDAGFDRPTAVVQDWLLADGARRALGFKYHRITGRDVALADKEPYDRGAALEAVEAHAEDFASYVSDQAGLVVAPYDAELFGHWWFEGPDFLDRVGRRLEGEMTTPSAVIDAGERFVVTVPAASSWGAGGHAETWLNEATDWIWPELHDAADRLTRLAKTFVDASGIVRRAVVQAGRELLLASASDWPFILSNRTVTAYATARVRGHLARFDELVRDIEANHIDVERLVRYEAEDNAFADLEPADFAADG